MDSTHIEGILLVIFSSAWKFAATFPVAVYLLKMSFMEVILYTNIGGIIGIVFFIFLSKGIIHVANLSFLKWLRMRRKQPKKIFTRRSRKFVTIKKRFGLAGIITLTPVLFSIPVGTFLIARYYDRRKMNYVYLFVSQVVWSFLYTFFYTRIKVSL